MRRAAKMDAFHAEVRELFRKHGCAWRDTPLGAGFPDAVVGVGELLWLIEVKSGAKAARRKGRTAFRQDTFVFEFPAVTKVSTLEEAVAVIKMLKARQALWGRVHRLVDA